MVSTVLVLAAAALALGLAWSLLAKGRLALRTGQDWKQTKHDIDVQVFQTLLDHNEQRYLRRSLPPRQFKLLHRRRIRLALRMLQLVEKNAEMLIRLGHVARLKHDPELTGQANELIATAIRFRFNLLLAKPCLYMEWLLPSLGSPLAILGVRYRHLLDSLARLQQRECEPIA
jgi:hypothetical protein